MACSKRSLCKQVACEWDMIVALSEIRLEVCFLSLNERLQQVILVGILKLKRLSYLYVKLQWNRSHVGMEVEQSSRPDSKPLRNILWLQAEQSFVSLIMLHLPLILKIPSKGTWLFNLSKITFLIYKP